MVGCTFEYLAPVNAPWARSGLQAVYLTCLVQGMLSALGHLLTEVLAFTWLGKWKGAEVLSVYLFHFPCLWGSYAIC